MKVIIKNYETGEIINKISTKESELSKAIKEIEKLQKTEDILKLGETGKTSREQNSFGLGIFTIIQSGPIQKTNDVNHAKEPTSIKINGRDTNVKIELYAYKEGLVLKTGKNVPKGLFGFGGIEDACFKKFTSKNVILSGIGDAKTFKTPSSLLSYLKKNQENFRFLVTKHGYEYSVEYVTTEFNSDIQLLSEKKKNKWDTDLKELNDYLETLNSETDEEQEELLPNEVNEKIISEEILSRMEKLELWENVIIEFKKGNIMMSADAGIIYSLDENAKKALSFAYERNLHPYHIIHTLTAFGNIYDVLYVSEDTEDWSEERLNCKNNHMFIMSYNSSFEDVEFGEIEVMPVNGGLKRIS